MSKWRGIVAALVLALGLGVAGTAPASASAYSCTSYGVSVPGVGRTAQFCGDTRGTGLYVQSIGAGYSSPIAWAGWLRDTRVRAEFIDTTGRVYLSYLSSIQSGGSSIGAWKWTLNRYVRQGTLRYTLLSNGATIAVVQQTIKP